MSKHMVVDCRRMERQGEKGELVTDNCRRGTLSWRGNLNRGWYSELQRSVMSWKRLRGRSIQSIGPFGAPSSSLHTAFAFFSIKCSLSVGHCIHQSLLYSSKFMTWCGLPNIIMILLYKLFNTHMIQTVKIILFFH